MKKINLHFSVLKYIPSPIRRESINVGIAVHIPNQFFSKFYSIHSTKRLASFDDEYDKDFFKMMMDSFHYELDYPTTTDNELSFNTLLNDEVLSDPNFLLTQTGDYSNEFQFESVNIMRSTEAECDEDIHDLIKTYLYYDRPKSARITATEVKRLLSKQLRVSKFSEVQRSPEVPSDFTDNSLFDFKIGDYYIKVISFDYAKNSTMAKELKSALYDLNEATTELNIKKIKVVINDQSEASNSSAYDLFNQKVKHSIATNNQSVEIVPLSDFISSKF